MGIFDRFQYTATFTVWLKDFFRTYCLVKYEEDYVSFVLSLTGIIEKRSSNFI